MNRVLTKLRKEIDTDVINGFEPRVDIYYEDEFNNHLDKHFYEIENEYDMLTIKKLRMELIWENYCDNKTTLVEEIKTCLDEYITDYAEQVEKEYNSEEYDTLQEQYNNYFKEVL